MKKYLNPYEKKHSAKELSKDWPEKVMLFILKAFEKEEFDPEEFENAIAITNSLRGTVHIYVNDKHVCNFNKNFEENTFFYGSYPFNDKQNEYFVKRGIKHVPPHRNHKVWGIDIWKK